jgi:dihydroorotase
VRQARAQGVLVTAEVTPHHLALTHEAVMHTANGGAPSRAGTLAYETNAKMYPPLRSQEDVEACIEGLRDGTIDAIATDHAPHAVQEKLCEFDDAAFGITGLETAFALAMRAVGATSNKQQATRLSLERVMEALTIGPVRALGLDAKVPGLGSLSEGAPADIVLIDPAREWTVEPSQFASKGKNTPLAGQTLRGQVVTTIFAGKVVHMLEGVAG